MFSKLVILFGLFVSSFSFAAEGDVTVCHSSGGGQHQNGTCVYYSVDDVKGCIVPSTLGISNPVVVNVSGCAISGTATYDATGQTNIQWSVVGYPEGTVCPAGHVVDHATGACKLPDCPQGQIRNASGECISTFDAEADAAAREYAKQLAADGYSVGAQNAGYGAFRDAYVAARESGLTIEESVSAGMSSGFGAAVDWTRQYDRDSIMSRAVLTALALTGAVAAAPAFIAGGSLAAATMMALSVLSTAGVAVDAFYTGSSSYPPSDNPPVLNVRLNDSSPSLASVAEIAYNDNSRTFDVVPAMNSSSWTTNDNGSMTTVTDVNGENSSATINNNRTTVTAVSPSPNVPGSVTTVVEAISVQSGSTTLPAISVSRTYPVYTSTGEIYYATRTDIYSPDGTLLNSPVVAVASGNVDLNSPGLTLGAESGGTGAPIVTQFPVGTTSTTGTGTGSTGGGTGTGAGGNCGNVGAGQPACLVDVSYPNSPYVVDDALKTDINRKADDEYQKYKDAASDISAEPLDDEGGLFSWAFLPKPPEGSCVDPVITLPWTQMSLGGFCDRMAMLRAAAEYILALITIFYVFRCLTNSSRSEV